MTVHDDAEMMRRVRRDQIDKALNRDWPEDGPGWDTDDDDGCGNLSGSRDGGLGSGDWIEKLMERDIERDMEVE